MNRSVKEVAKLTGVSVRALHYYDEIGLLVPSARTGAGYRIYDDTDLLRLQQILIGRELGLSLEEIRRFLDDPCFDHEKALLQQKRQLTERAVRTETMIRAVEAALAALHDARKETAMSMNQIFDGFDPSGYEEEAQQRWGHTEAFRASVKRTRRYTPDDWKRCLTEQAAVYADANSALTSGKAAESPEARAIAERHRLAIDRWFYPCDRAMHARLADLYEADQRFAANIDRYGAGLTPFLAAAIRANAGGRGVE